MADKIVEVHDGGGGGSSMTALAIVLMLIVLLVVLYFTGVFGRMFGSKKTDINVDINKPNVVLQLR